MRERELKGCERKEERRHAAKNEEGEREPELGREGSAEGMKGGV